MPALVAAAAVSAVAFLPLIAAILAVCARELYLIRTGKGSDDAAFWSWVKLRKRVLKPARGRDHL
jgi:hypothetical protein